MAETVESIATVPEELAGLRLDQAAARLFEGHSRVRLTAWIRGGELRVDGQAAKPKQPVNGGEILTIKATVQAASADRPQAIDLTIAFEDDHLLIVEKPAGLVVHPGAGNRDGTLVNGLLHHYPAAAVLPRAGIVHRLDRETSGALLVAKTAPAYAALVAMMKAREIDRRYDATVEGVLVSGMSIDAPIGRHPVDRLRMAVREDGRPARTHVRVRERFRSHTRLAVTLETGRTHQIRVHMAERRHPLVGDLTYGRGPRPPRGADPALLEALRGFRRQALHAEQLAFMHPVTGVAISVDVPPPADLIALLATLRADARAAAENDDR